VTDSPNVELVRSIGAAWERGDFNSAEWTHREITFASPDGMPSGSWTGPAEMARTWREVVSAWDDIRVTTDEFRELDHERVLVLCQFSGRGKTSGIRLGPQLTKGALLFKGTRGKVTRLVMYMDYSRAFADLGLAPEGDAS
jgi:hypothetical protein